MTSDPTTRHRRRFRVRSIVLHVVRVSVVLLICLIVRAEHAAFERTLAARGTAPVDLKQLAPYLPRAARIGDEISDRGGRAVFDDDDRRIGEYLFTSPGADSIVGYAGPSNLLIVLDAQDRIAGIEIITSSDTPEHVDLVRKQPTFLSELIGLPAETIATDVPVDGVSGATLTSLAMVEAVKYRLGAPRRSLRFPNRTTLSEVRRFLPRAAALSFREGNGVELADVMNGDGHAIGWSVRGSPRTDRIVGYQGPSDLLLVFDRRWRLLGFTIRASFDNQPYVRYVEEDEPFRSLFRQLSIDELSRFDLEAEEVEGVSGATMTSMAVARILIEAVRGAQSERQRARRSSSIRWASHDWGTLLVMLAALVLSRRPLRNRRRLQQLFGLILIGYFGFLNGDMLSQALLVGWTQHGVPWRIAPALAILAAIALLLPIAFGEPWYCHRVCPFGAVQMLVRRRIPWQWHTSRRADRLLRTIPPLLLGVVLFAALTHRSWNLASIEPFHAFLWRVAGWSTIIIAVAGALLSAVKPMAYCRYGCPTGALLEMVRYKRHGHRLRWTDAAAAVLLLLALLLRTWSPI